MGAGRRRDREIGLVELRRTQVGTVELGLAQVRRLGAAGAAVEDELARAHVGLGERRAAQDGAQHVAAAPIGAVEEVRTGVVQGKSASVGVDLGGMRIIKKKKNKNQY